MSNKKEIKTWNEELGSNLSKNISEQNELMLGKNEATQGEYQAEASGMQGEFSLAVIAKALPKEYIAINDILIQQGVWYRPYGEREMQLFGAPNWKLAIRVYDKKTKKKKYRDLTEAEVSKLMRMHLMLNGKKVRLFEKVMKSTQIDHLIISPYGLFIIETKNHKGMIFGDADGYVWTQTLIGTKGIGRFTIYNPNKQNAEHIQALNQYCKIGYNMMTSIIAFTNPDVDLTNLRGNNVCKVKDLPNMLSQYKNVILNDNQIRAIINVIEKVDTNNYTNAQEHIKYVKDIEYHNKRMRDIKRGQ